MNTYKTTEVANIIGIHPNTVRLYEELGLIPKPKRQANGYRVFTNFHIEQFKLARTALKVEVLQNGLRKEAVAIIKTSASGNFNHAIRLTENYLLHIRMEQQNAEEALAIARQILNGNELDENNLCLTRKETADYLQVSIDTLRNWEMNSLLIVKRKQNGYRVYTSGDIRRLKIIRSLRCANYSLTAILRLLGALSYNPNTDIRRAIDTPNEDDEIISVCDKLLTSLLYAKQNAGKMQAQLEKMKEEFKSNPTC